MLVAKNQHQDKHFKTLKYAILASVFFHLAVILLRWQPEIQNEIKSIQEKVTRIKLVEPEQIEKISEVRKKEVVKRQIVTTEKSDLDIKPVPTRFLSEQNQAVDRQTVAKDIGSFKEAAKGVANGAETQVAKESKAERVSKKEKVSLAALGQVKIPKSQALKEAKKELSSLGIKNGREGLTGLARNNDYVEDIPLGDMTKLNTVEFKYYGFYHRIKQRLEQHWGKSLKEKAESMAKKGRIPASEDRITALSITLDSAGQIVDIELRSSSGVSEFDEAAIDSFNKAGPFPNPPQGMMVNGKATIEWGFVVKS